MTLPSKPPRPPPPPPPPEPSSNTSLHLASEASHPQIAPHTCHHCLPFTLDFLPLLRDPSLTITTIPNLTQHQVVTAAKDGCRLFASIEPSIFSTDPYYRLDVGSPSVTYNLWLNIHPKTKALQIKIAPSNNRHGSGPYFDIYRLPGSKANVNPATLLAHTSLPPNLAPASDLSFTRLRSFLSTCIDTHDECRVFTTSNGAPFIPARILELSGPPEAPNIRLRSSSSLTPSSSSHPPPYAILSYCWGGDQPSKLLSSRLTSYLQDIPRDTLPAAVLDACHAASRLGFRYLWVDALCIIQDDPADKILQIGQMHRIFRGATLTIAAEMSPSSNHGFLHPRIDHQASLVRLSAGPDHQDETVVFVPRIYYPSYSETLHTRGWTFQETHLSARIIAYGNREPVFHCLTSRLTDGGAPPSPDYSVDLSTVAKLMDPGSALMLGSPSSKPHHPYDWIAMTSAYRARHLTVNDDRLPGIAALAEEDATRTKFQGPADYLAGMWRTDLLVQCLWTFDNGLLGPLKSLPKYIAPSWSWASLPPLEKPWYNGPEDIDQWTWSTLLDAGTTLQEPKGTPYGAITNGFLHLRARRRRALRWYIDGPSDTFGVSICFRAPDGSWDSDNFTVTYMDEWEDYKRPNPLGRKGGVPGWLVELCHRTEGEADDARVVSHGLILEEIKSRDGISVFHRNGVFEHTAFPDKSPFDHPEAELCDMTLT